VPAAYERNHGSRGGGLVTSRQVFIYGASGFGREVAWLLEECVRDGMGYTILGFIDDDTARHGTVLNSHTLMGIDRAAAKYPMAGIVSGIGNPIFRKATMENAKRYGFSFETVIHPNVRRSERIEIGEGTVICAGNTLTTNIVLGCHVQINLNCTIGHDAVLGDFTTLSPGVHVSGWVHFGKRVYVGTGAVMVNGTSDHPIYIGDDVVIGAGACVTRSIPDGETWVGIPARPIRYSKKR